MFHKFLSSVVACVALCSSSFGQTISSPTVNANGTFSIQVSTLSTGGTYNFNWGTNNDPRTSTPTVVLTVSSPGYDDTGTATTVTRTVYGSCPLRNPWSTGGAQFTKQESGTAPVTLTFALSDEIYSSDTATVTIGARFYTQGVASNALASTSVTNNSTLSYPKVVGNWSMPGYDKIGNTQTLRFVAFQKFGQQFRPVRCIKFTSTDAHSNSATATVLRPTFDKSFGDAQAVNEYIGQLNTSGFTQNDVVTSNAKCYPWIGDSTSVLDTSTGTAPPSPLVGPQKYVCDKGGTYCTAFAVVDYINGNDTGASAGTLSTNYTTCLPFKTIGKAVDSIRAANNSGTYGATHNDAGGGTIYLLDNAGAANTHYWLGTAPTAGSSPVCNLLIAGYPGKTRANCVISNYGTSSTIGTSAALVKLQGVKISADNGGGVFSGALSGQYWFDNCEFNIGTNNGPTVYQVGLYHVTRSLISAWPNGLVPYSNVNCSTGILRGCTIPATSLSLTIRPYTAIGNYKSAVSDVGHFSDLVVAGGCPQHTNTVVAFNRWTYGSASASLLGLRQGYAESNGLAVVQNIFEAVTGTNTPLFQVAADGSTTYGPTSNVILWGNVIVGQRTNLAYAENGAQPGYRLNWSVQNNFIDQTNLKTDTFGGNSCTGTVSGTTPGTIAIVQSYHGFNPGDQCYVTGFTGSSVAYNGLWTVATVTDSSHFTYTVTSNVGACTGSPSIGPNANRTGNWQQMYSMGWAGNVCAETYQIDNGTGQGGFQRDFPGIASIVPAAGMTNQLPTTQPVTSGYNTLAWSKFKNRQSYDYDGAGGNGAGNGDYSFLPSSPVNALRPLNDLIPYDLLGNPRSAGDPAGGYSPQKQRAMTLAF